MSATSSRVLLAAVGDANDPRTWSGIPYHFLQEARERGLLDEGLALTAEDVGYRSRRAAWNAWSVITGSGLGGYQYSVAFLERLWRGALAGRPSASLVNCFQLYPPSIVHDARHPKWFFIDQTLTQLFDAYGVRAKVGSRLARDALAREREGYESAAGIVAHSRWAAASLASDYGIPSAKVRVIQPGANFNANAYAAWDAAATQGPVPEDRPVELVCVGKDWRRKGIDRLLRAFDIVRRRGHDARLRLIGCDRLALPEDVRSIAGVEYAGFIDKRNRASEFLPLIASADIGCLVSRAEAGGIALREYHAVGLPTLATDAGGAPEHAIPEASVRVPAAGSAEDVAQVIEGLVSDRARLARLKETAWKMRHEALWSRTIQRIQATGGFGAAPGVVP